MNRRPLGDPRTIENRDVWESLARNLSCRLEKAGASKSLRRAAGALQRRARGCSAASTRAKTVRPVARKDDIARGFRGHGYGDSSPDIQHARGVRDNGAVPV